MGQQCIESSGADAYEFGKNKSGIKITGNEEGIQSFNESLIHFKQNSQKIELSPQVLRIKQILGKFNPTKSFNLPRGTSEPHSYNLNDEGLIYCQNGEWQNGMPHGRGQMIFPDGSYYEGYFENGVPNGQGRFINSQGWFYQGKLKNEQADGKGKFIHERIGIQYQGQWAADLPNGNGIETWRTNNSITTYEGQFVNGSKHGNGKYTCPDYSYEGSFQNNKIHGKGKIIYKNGQSFEGNFANGKKHGYGTYKWSDNSIFEGIYSEDVRNGTGRFINSSGNVFQCKWVNGKRQGKQILNIMYN